MKKINPPRRIPEGSPVYFTTEIPGKGEHCWRMPRTSVGVRLIRHFYSSGVFSLSQNDSNGLNDLSAEIGEEISGGVIGICWRHRTKELETKRRDFPRGDEGLMDFGEQVMQELHDEGYTLDDLTLMTSQVFSRLVTNLPSPQKEVDDLVDFTAPRTVKQTLSTST